MRINLTVPQFSFAIGSFVATDYLDSFAISLPQSEMETPLIWSGDFEVSYNRKAQTQGISQGLFDPITNPSIWRPGQQPVHMTIQGYPLPTLRIERYSYNAQTRQGRGTLTQILSLVSGDRPAAEPDVKLTQVDISEVVQALCALGFAQSRVTRPVYLTGLTGQIHNPIATRDPFSDAQRLCATNWRWVHIDSTEALRTVSGDPSAQPIVFARSIEEVAAWEPDLDAINFAAEQVIVTGSRDVPDDSIYCIDADPNPALDHRGRLTRESSYTEQPRALVFPSVAAVKSDFRLTVSERTTTYRKYNRDFVGPNFQHSIPYAALADFNTATIFNTPDFDSVTPIAELTVVEEPRGKLFSGLGADTTLIISQIRVKTPYIESSYKPYSQLYPSGKKIDTTLVVESWQRTDGDRLRQDNNHTGEIDPRTGRSRCLEKPLEREPQQYAPDKRLKTEVIRGEARVAPAGWTPLTQAPYVVDLGFIPSQQHADMLARQIALREERRRNAVQIEMPLPIEWLAAGCPPLARCLVHDGEFMIDGPIIALDGESLKFSFNGGRIRQLASPILAPAPAPPYLPGGLTLLVPPTIAAIVGVPIQPLQLLPGTIAYNLPAGLTISANGLLSGTVLQPFSGSISLQNGTQSNVLWLTSSAPPTGGLLVAEQSSISIDYAIDWQKRDAESMTSVIEIDWQKRDAVPVLLNSAIEIGVIQRLPQIITASIEIDVTRPNSGGFSSNIAPLLGSANLTQFISYEVDDDYVLLPDIGFDFTFYGVNRRNQVYVGSNSYITFGFGSTYYSNFSSSTPGRGLFVAADDPYQLGLWAGSDGPGRYRIRYVGENVRGSDGSGRVWEVTLFSDGVIQLAMSSTLTTVGFSQLTDGTGSNFTPYTIAPGSSWVFTPVGAGYTAAVGSYSL
jgi:hypothetical protein